MNEIRFDLEDMIYGNLIEDILYSIDMMSKKTTIKKIIFWHDGRLNDTQINEFRNKANEIIKKNTTFQITEKGPQKEYAWFDVISDQKNKGCKSRFSYVYPSGKKSEMILGIHSYFTVASFIENSGQSKRVYYKPNVGVGIL